MIGVPAGAMNRAALTALGAAALALTAAACGMSPSPTATPIGTPPVPGARSVPAGSAAPSARAAAHVGTDCGIIPPRGGASLRSMGTRQALAAASANPQLSVFTAAARTAGLDKTLQAKRTFTLMIPANAAFAALSKTDLIHLHNSGDLKKIVSYHAMNASISPGQFTGGASVRTLEGSALRLSRAGPAYKVNGATVLCGNIRTASGTVYIISEVLLPPGG